MVVAVSEAAGVFTTGARRLRVVAAFPFAEESTTFLDTLGRMDDVEAELDTAAVVVINEMVDFF